MNDFAPLASWNGIIQPLADLKIPATDRGFLFGDGVYEAIRLYQGRPFLLDDHLERLKYSLGQIQIEHSVNQVRQSLLALVAQFPKCDGLAYLQVTRGAAPLRNHLFPVGVPPNEMIYVTPLEDPLARYRSSGITTTLTADNRWHRPDIKSLNLLPNVLMRQKAFEAGAQEAILERWDGRITEATSSNVFVVKDGVVRTPLRNQWILGGVSRNLIAGLSQKAGIPFSEDELTRASLWEANEIFLSSTTSEVIAVTKVEKKTISGGRPGPITERIHELFKESIQFWLRGA
ncbi:MAG: aminotransferase class IV [Deltaproteobacteria bacterium]|nr:aminotransferase class IV [Deltaproteobacteria bacterium]MBI3295298.1 aminotransferase class IV [Deltaproteobacteria bacterium]